MIELEPREDAGESEIETRVTEAKKTQRQIEGDTEEDEIEGMRQSCRRDVEEGDERRRIMMS